MRRIAASPHPPYRAVCALRGLVGEGVGTQVTWSMHGNMGSNPLFRWLALFGDRMVGPDFEAGLANLKALAEKPQP